MKIEEICQYLNELGILSIKNTPLFLSIYSGLVKNNLKSIKNNNIENNQLTIILFAFLKKIITNDKELYELSSNIIHSHKKNKLIRQYQGICFFKKIIYHQIKNRFNHFLFLLFTKKYPKRKYFPYNPLYAAKSSSRLNEINTNKSFTNTNTNLRRNNNFLNINDEYSVSYISNRHNNKNYNRIIFNTGSDEGWKSENIKGNKRKNSSSQPFVHLLDLAEKMNMKKEEISKNNLKKKLYEAKIRINNYENIIPISRRNRKKEMKSIIEENNNKKLKEDRIYEKLTEKDIDPKNILDRLYRKEIIKKQDMKRKEKENENMKRAKSPIDWVKVNDMNSKKKCLNININSDEVNSINQVIDKPKKNINFSRDVFSFGKTSGNQNNKPNQNININNNKIEYNNKNNQKIINYNEFSNNDHNNNLKQLNENELGQNIKSNEENEYEDELQPNEDNEENQQVLYNYSLNKNNPQEKNDNLLEKENCNNEEEEIELLNQNNNNNNNNEYYNNFPQQIITQNNKDINEPNDEQINEEEKFINNNKMKLPNEQNEYQYENNYEEEEGEEEEGENNEEYNLENEEIEYNLDNNIDNNMDVENNGNEKINSENNYQELFGENIEEYLDNEDKEN